MGNRVTPHIAIVHLDESCLGNGREGDNPGGAGGLIEMRIRSGVRRKDFSIHAPATTNNRMALAGASVVLELLGAKGARLRVLMISDSQYLIKGIREWVPSWRRRNWTRKGGPIENLSLWQQLVAAASTHEVQWAWVRGHAGHPKNEYANDLAVEAATTQTSSGGVVDSRFASWLGKRRAKGRYPDYDPDAAFRALEKRMQAGERFLVAE